MQARLDLRDSDIFMRREQYYQQLLDNYHKTGLLELTLDYDYERDGAYQTFARKQPGSIPQVRSDMRRIIHQLTGHRPIVITHTRYVWSKKFRDSRGAWEIIIPSQKRYWPLLRWWTGVGKVPTTTFSEYPQEEKIKAFKQHILDTPACQKALGLPKE